MTAIELSGIQKQFGSVVALDGVDLTVEEGEIYGFLGPNGAGKSTAINLLLDFIRPTAGTARVFGVDCQNDPLSVRQRIGVLPEGYDVYDRLSGRKHVEFAIECKDADDDPHALLERVGLLESTDRKAGGYSKGMKQRLLLAMALAGDPDLLILDEPTTGLDPNGARRMRELIRTENERGATVFFSSHILSQVEAVCDSVGILNEGKIVAENDISSLQDQLGADTTLTIRVRGFPNDILDELRALPGVSSVQATKEELVVGCESDVKMDVLLLLENQGYEVVDFSIEEASLERLFEAYTTQTRGIEA